MRCVCMSDYVEYESFICDSSFRLLSMIDGVANESGGALWT